MTEHAPDSTFDIRRPVNRTSPVVFASPHSGSRYPQAFLEQSGLDRLAVRRSEDAFVDELFAAAPDFGAPLITAQFPRAYVDANREPFELDPAMFDDALPSWVNTTSPRVAAGLGTVARIVAGGAEIYSGPLSFCEVEARIRKHHIPYHEALSGLIDETLDLFGCCLVVDCHSMPSMAVPGIGRAQPDVVLGDCHGSTCNREISLLAERTLTDLGLTVTRNKPYAGGYTTRHYARPSIGVQTLQIEVNRALYMNEAEICKNAGFERLAERLKILVASLARLTPDRIHPSMAAE
jgi:N-formylglutamate amidohydrolase